MAAHSRRPHRVGRSAARTHNRAHLSWCICTMRAMMLPGPGIKPMGAQTRAYGSEIQISDGVDP
jgi:hypothetical protein